MWKRPCEVVAECMPSTRLKTARIAFINVTIIYKEKPGFKMYA